MDTEPLTGARKPEQSDGPLGGLQISHAVDDLAPLTDPYFATTSARDTAFSNWVAAGHTMRDGLHCYVSGIGDLVYQGGQWLPAERLNMVLAGEQTSTQSSASSTQARIVGFTNLTGTFYSDLLYEWKWSSLGQADTVGAVLSIIAHGRSGSSAASTDTVLAQGAIPFQATGGPGAQTLEFSELFTVLNTGTYTISAYIARAAGTGTVTVSGRPRAQVRPVGLASSASGVIQLS